MLELIFKPINNLCKCPQKYTYNSVVFGSDHRNTCLLDALGT